MGKLIGIFATEISSRLQGNFYKQLHKKATELGYNLVFFSANLERLNSDDTDEHAMDLFGMSDRMTFSAFIIHAQSLRNKDLIEHVIEMGKRRDIPIFVCDCDSMGYTKEDGIITINLDYKQGFADCVKHIVECHNCKSVYMLAGMRGNKFSDDRIDVYKEVLTSHGMDVSADNIMYGDFWELPAREAVLKLINSDLPKPDAICCANDSMAIAAARVLEEQGYHVPDDVRITGFDGIEDGKYNFPIISTCQPIWTTIPDLVFDDIAKDVRSGEYYVPLKFYPKESCGCDNADAINDRKEMARLMQNNRLNTWQHSMLSNMQLQLMDSSNPSDITDYMNGIIGMFKGYKHLYCIRDNIECVDDWIGAFDKMRIHLNLEFLPDKDYGVFRAQDIIPNYEQVFLNAEPDEIFIFHMLKSVEKKYGYSVIRANYYSTTQIKIFFQFAESFTNMMESILRNRQLEQANRKLSEMYERMSEIYIRDMMTGLYNRTGYYKELDSYILREDIRDKYIHIITVDMDGMKLINDNYGHQEGDIAIKAVARAIGDCFAQPYIGARFGGDEFVVALFSDSEDKPDQARISKRLNDYLKAMPSLKDKEYSVGASVGHAVCRVSELKDIKELEKQADDSMYVDKHKRKGIKQ
ncbi:MAG: GGDEF domain-containing protein [Lachnospiraceae bacterium]|nr:GGDEF domain-containing protein [Lachnospiraceae bacterium]